MGGVVMLFFVLSGFCIHLPNASKNLPINWGAYAVRRFMRIYPAYLVTLLLCLLAALIFFSAGGDQSGELNVYAASSVMVQNWIYGGRQIAINPSLWTIPVEVEAYILYPILLWIFRSRGASGASAFTLLMAAMGVIMFELGYGQATITIFKYAVIWGSGAWLAEAYARRHLPTWSGWYWFVMAGTATCTMVAGFAGVDVFFLHYGWAVVSFLLLLWVIGPGTRFFEVRHWWVPPMVLIGTVSYSFYLLHFPLFKLAGTAWVHSFGSKPESFLVPTMATLLVIPMAWCFYCWVELPTHQLARQLGSTFDVKTKPSTTP